MKTLKQIREEYNSKYESAIELVESKDGGKDTNIVPSSAKMPAILVFRRKAYRLYPNKQVVALYYSNLVDKYLSIPFGPGGNLNLSESTIIDPSDLDEGWKETADSVADVVVPYYSAGKKALKGDWGGAAKDAAVDTALMAVGGPVAKGIAKIGGKALIRGTEKLGARTAVKTAEKAATKSPKPTLGSRIKDAGKSATKAAAAGGAGALASSASNAIKNVMSGPQDDPKTHREIVKGHGKTYSSWSKAQTTNPTVASKEHGAYEKAVKNVKENKMSDLRNMINEGFESMNIQINGRPFTLNTSMAKRILEVYDSVNTKNKKIVESMLNDDLESFKKLLNFSIKA